MNCPPHRYVLPGPNGPTVSGSCKKCGARRTWLASLEEINVTKGWTKAQEARLKIMKEEG